MPPVVKNPPADGRRHERWEFDPWVRKISWSIKWQPIPVFLPGKNPWTEEPGRLQSLGLQRVRCDWAHIDLVLRGVHFLELYSFALWIRWWLHWLVNRNFFKTREKHWVLFSWLISGHVFPPQVVSSQALANPNVGEELRSTLCKSLRSSSVLLSPLQYYSLQLKLP